MTQPPIVVLTDFGNQDPFVGIMKGVINRLAPTCSIIDLSNEIPPGDLLQGAITLWRSQPYFQDGSIFLSVIDPGVGTSRLGIAARIGRQFFIGPDNGLLSFVFQDGSECRALDEAAYQLPEPGSTFHGRDVFAPAAAHLAGGADLSTFGRLVREPVRLPSPRWQIMEDGGLEGEVLFGDRFGNALTSLGKLRLVEAGFHVRGWLPGPKSEFDLGWGSAVRLQDGRRLEYARTFGDIPQGEFAWIVGSTGLIEIAANQNRAVEGLQLRRGSRVTLEGSRQDAARR
jgi:S-adenosylmethionine hydrolase